MKNSISVRQICFILIAYNAVTKLLIYPTAIAGISGNALIFSALFNLIVQTAVIWAVAFLSSKTDKTFFELLENTFGKIAARIIIGLFALYFLFNAIIPMNEQQLLVQEAFYDTVPSLYFFLPFFFFSIYAGAKSFTNVGRCADICFPVFILTIIAFFVMSVGAGEYTNLLPVFRQPFIEVAEGSLAGVFRFSESAFLLMFLGHYKYRKGDSAKLTLSYFAGGLIVVIFMGIFYAIYGPLTPSRNFILDNIAVFFSGVRFIGRIDLILIYTIDMVILFAIVLNVQASVHCMCLAFGTEKSPLFSLAANTALIAVTFIVNNKYVVLQQAANMWFWIPAVIFAYILPVLAWTLRRKKR